MKTLMMLKVIKKNPNIKLNKQAGKWYNIFGFNNFLKIIEDFYVYYFNKLLSQTKKKKKLTK